MSNTKTTFPTFKVEVKLKPDPDRQYLDELRSRVNLPPRRNVLEYLKDVWGDLSYEFLFISQMNTDFFQLMINRLIMGGLRYGVHCTKGKKKYDRVASIKKRLEAYNKTGNMEHLVDIANEALCEYTDPSHPKAHFQASDDTGYHTEETK